MTALPHPTTFWTQPYALTGLITCVLAVLLGVLVLWKGPRSPAARWWTIMCFWVAGWAYWFVQSLLSSSADVAIANLREAPGAPDQRRRLLVIDPHYVPPLHHALCGQSQAKGVATGVRCFNTPCLNHLHFVVRFGSSMEVRHVVGGGWPRAFSLRRIFPGRPGIWDTPSSAR